MNGVTFLVLLAVCSVVTSLTTEAEKKFFEDFPKNVLALLTGIVVGVVVVMVYFFIRELTYTTTDVVYMILLAVSSGFGAMLGYDKVIQTIKQIKEMI